MMGKNNQNRLLTTGKQFPKQNRKRDKINLTFSQNQEYE
jgi:hypothetical protein